MNHIVNASFIQTWKGDTKVAGNGGAITIKVSLKVISMLNKASESFDKPDRVVQAFHGLTAFWVPEGIRTEECELKTSAVYIKASFLS